MLAIVSLMISLFFSMHAYNFVRMRKVKEKAETLGAGGMGSSVGAFASIFGAATCPMCVASLFGFMGSSAVGFLLRYQWWVFASSLFLMLTSLYFVSAKVNSVCKKCV